MSNAGVLKVSHQLVLESLGLPEDTTILGAWMAPFGVCVWLAVEHPDLPEVPEGAPLPILTPIFARINFDWNTNEDS
jgi:hypothetical protein